MSPGLGEENIQRSSKSTHHLNMLAYFTSGEHGLVGDSNDTRNLGEETIVKFL